MDRALDLRGRSALQALQDAAPLWTRGVRPAASVFHPEGHPAHQATALWTPPQRPVLVNAKEFTKAVAGNGIGITTNDSKLPLRIPRDAENKHFLIVGDTGSGKSSIIRQMLYQVDARGDSAIVYDPACEFVKQFYDQHRGDIVLNPLDARMPYWNPSKELRRKAEAKALAVSLYQPEGVTNRFFVEAPQKIFAHLLSYLPTPEDLIKWMSDPAEIDRRVKGTEYWMLIDPKAPQQRTGVLGSLNMSADSFRLLPKEDETTSVWTATKWAETRRGWIFITSRPTMREALRPLISLWIDTLVLRLLNEPMPDQKPVWFVIDELASLQRLPQLHTAITENRKSQNPVILGFQGRSQMEARYGEDAEAMLSQPATKIFLRTTEPRAAKWVSEAIGEVEIERLRETHYDGSRAGQATSRSTGRPSRSFCLPRSPASTTCAASSSTAIMSRDSRFRSLRSKRRAPDSMNERWTT